MAFTGDHIRQCGRHSLSSSVLTNHSAPHKAFGKRARDDVISAH